MNRLLLFTAIAVLVAGTATAQSLRKSSYSREISMDVDNDIFFFIDYYYTAGQNLAYRRLVNPQSKFYRRFHAGSVDSSKLIVSWSGGFKIFTPVDIDHADTKTMDRPYAGWSYVRYSLTNFPKPTVSNQYEIETGFVGPNSGMGQLQRWVHQATDFEVPAGWGSQIRNETVINFYYTRVHEILVGQKINIVSQSALQGGTGGNKLSQDLTLRAIRFNSIENSAFAHNRLSWDKPSQDFQHKNEFFLFFGAGLDYVMSNIFIQGSLFRDHKSVFTVPMQPIIFRQSFGVMFSSHSITWNITTVHLSKEVRHGRDHEYASLGMAVRF